MPNEYTYGDMTYATVDLAFVCDVEDLSQAQARDEIEKVMIVPNDQLNPENFGLTSIRRIVARYLRVLRSL